MNRLIGTGRTSVAARCGWQMIYWNITATNKQLSLKREEDEKEKTHTQAMRIISGPVANAPRWVHQILSASRRRPFVIRSNYFEIFFFFFIGKRLCRVLNAPGSSTENFLFKNYFFFQDFQLCSELFNEFLHANYSFCLNK